MHGHVDCLPARARSGSWPSREGVGPQVMRIVYTHQYFLKHVIYIYIHTYIHIIDLCVNTGHRRKPCLLKPPRRCVARVHANVNIYIHVRVSMGTSRACTLYTYICICERVCVCVCPNSEIKVILLNIQHGVGCHNGQRLDID